LKQHPRYSYGQAKLKWTGSALSWLDSELKWDVDDLTGNRLVVSCASSYKRGSNVVLTLKNVTLNGMRVVGDIQNNNDAEFVIVKKEGLGKGFIFTAVMKVESNGLLLHDDKAYCNVYVERGGKVQGDANGDFWGGEEFEATTSQGNDCERVFP